MKVNIDMGALCLLLTLIFLTLKLGQWGLVASWSWWAVFAPIWVPLAVIGGIMVLLLLIAGIILVLEGRGD